MTDENRDREEEEEERVFSGRLLIRMPRYLHREITEIAREQGVSVNQFVCLAAAAAAGVARSEEGKAPLQPLR